MEFVSSRVRQAILDASTQIPDSTTTPEESKDLAQPPGADAQSVVSSSGTHASAPTSLTRGPAKILEQYYECRRFDSNSQSSTGKHSVDVDNFGFWNQVSRVLQIAKPPAADRAVLIVFCDLVRDGSVGPPFAPHSSCTAWRKRQLTCGVPRMYTVERGHSTLQLPTPAVCVEVLPSESG